MRLMSPERAIRDIVRLLPTALNMARAHGVMPVLRRALRRLAFDGRAVRAAAPDVFDSIDRERFLSILNTAIRDKRVIWVQYYIIHWNTDVFARPQHMTVAMAGQGALSIYLTTEIPHGEYRKITDNIYLFNDLTVFRSLKGAIISFYSTSEFSAEKFISRLQRHNVIVYEYIDHIDENISGKHRIGYLLKGKEYFFAGGAHVIAASARKLHDEATETAAVDEICYVPNGVDYNHYAEANRQRQSTLPERIEDFVTRHEAIVGYFGVLAPWFWYEMVNEVTERRSELGFLFIGPEYHYGEYRKLIPRDNVLVTGSVPYKDLPYYAKGFDVAIIPFREGEVAQTTSPLKLFEYFALEHPIVVTRAMYECTVYPEVFVASDSSEFSRCIDHALKTGKSEEFRARMRTLAVANDWSERVRTILEASEKISQ